MESAFKTHPTDPAPLILAEATCHMVTTIRLFNPWLAFRALVTLTALGPFSEDLCFNLSTAYTLMPGEAACFTETIHAFPTLDLVWQSELWHINEGLTVWRGTELIVRVACDCHVVLETDVSLINLIGGIILDLFITDTIMAPINGTSYANCGLCITSQLFEVHGHAIFANLMTTFYGTHLTQMDIGVADFTEFHVPFIRFMFLMYAESTNVRRYIRWTSHFIHLWVIIVIGTVNR